MFRSLLSSSRLRRSSARSQASRGRKRSRLVLEELESRALLSASGPGSWIAQPSLSIAPLADLNPLVGSAGSAVYTPAQIRHAYGFDAIRFANGLPADGSGQTIAIVDAYDDPNVASDLWRFDHTLGVGDPPSFVRAMPQGPPAFNAGWAGEIALDVEWAHAIAPKANILLVEARSASISDLLVAVNYARSQPGVVAVSMSWGSGEFYGEQAYNGYFTTPVGHLGGFGIPGGVAFVASSGDNGAWYGVQWPSVSPNVLAVGGTSLHLTAANTYASETAWSGSGGGVSRYLPEPSYQLGFDGSGYRTTPDVSYDADPNTGFYVYNTAGLAAGQSGWWIYGGTSAAAPQWAGLLALADQGRAYAGLGSLANAQSAVYALPASDFHDVTVGSNGYSALPGYDLVTGRGSPFGDRIVRDLVAYRTASAAAVKTSATGTKAPVGHAATGQPGDTGAVPADLVFALASRPATNTGTFFNQPLASFSYALVHWNQNSQADAGGEKALADGLAGDHSLIFAGHQERADGALSLFFDFTGTEQDDATDAE
jgi:hypothetical protein